MFSDLKFINAPRGIQLLQIFKTLGGGSGGGSGGSTAFNGLPVVVTGLPFRIEASFTRPADTNAYAQYDAITNSTSSPTILSATIPNAVANDFIEIRNVRVNTSTKPTGTKLNANVFFSKTSFTATNDNAELSIDDTTAAGGAWVSCINQFQTALNYRVSADPSAHLMQLASNTVYFTVQANNAWNPGNADVITVVAEGYIAKVTQ